MRRVVHQAALPVSTSAVLAGGIAAVLCLFAAMQPAEGLTLLRVKLLWAGVIGFMAYRVFRTGIIGFWRNAFFIILAWGFIVHFKSRLIGLTGSAFISPEVQEVPACHIALSSSILSALYHQYTAFMGGAWRDWAPLSSGILWLALTLALGQAWCAWGCMYGGLDSTFAALRRKPLLRWKALPKGLREMPAAVLLAMALLSLVTVKPAFCLWLCPLKLGTGFLEPHSATRIAQTVLFAGIAAVFLVALPVLTKKRAFCGLICPFGAWQAFAGRINPYRVTIRAQACTQCRKCVDACPTFAIDRDGLQQHRVSPYCNRCGECMDVCPTGAIDFTLKGQQRLALPPRWPRALFLATAWIVGGAVSLLFVPEALLRLARWVAHPWWA